MKKNLNDQVPVTSTLKKNIQVDRWTRSTGLQDHQQFPL